MEIPANSATRIDHAIIIVELAHEAYKVLESRRQRLPGLKPVDGVVWLRMLGSLVIGFVVTDQIVSFGWFERYTHAEWADQFADLLINGVGDPGATR